MDKHYKPTDEGQDYIDDDLDDSEIAAAHGEQPFDAMYALMQYFAFVDSQFTTPRHVRDEEAKLLKSMQHVSGSWDAKTMADHQLLVDDTLGMFERCVKCGLLEPVD